MIALANATRKCSVENCTRVIGRHGARGYCPKHYKRFKTHGDPLGGLSRYRDPKTSFAKRTEWQGDCLVWTGAIHRTGYGLIWVEGRHYHAHRYAWEQVNGPIPDGIHVDHTCFNKACCNIEHLRLANRSQNGSNKAGPNSDNQSGHRNVYRTARGYWSVQVRKDRQLHYFGEYTNLEEAAEIAQEAREYLFGEFAGRG